MHIRGITQKNRLLCRACGQLVFGWHPIEPASLAVHLEQRKEPGEEDDMLSGSCRSRNCYRYQRESRGTERKGDNV